MCVCVRVPASHRGLCKHECSMTSLSLLLMTIQHFFKSVEFLTNYGKKKVLEITPPPPALRVEKKNYKEMDEDKLHVRSRW